MATSEGDSYLVYDLKRGGEMVTVWRPTAPKNGPGYSAQEAGVQIAAAIHQGKRNARIEVVRPADTRRLRV